MKKVFLKLISINLTAAVFLTSTIAQSGVLIPVSVTDKPDEKILSLALMDVDICVDNQHATVKITQIYDNHTDQNLEGKFLFALPEKSAVSDFAVWDRDTRIPGVMLEKRRANEVYGQIKAAAIDPGILQQNDEKGGNSAFSAKVVPILPYGTKRLEMEYTETLAVEDLTSYFSFPLKNSEGKAQIAREFRLSLCILGDYPFSAPQFNADKFPLKITKHTEQEFEAEFAAKNFALSEDFSFNYKIEVPHSRLSFIAYRSPERISAYDLRNPAEAEKEADGFFQAQVIFNEHGFRPEPARRVLFMLDTSLSMYGEKLKSAVEAVEYFLGDLNERDEFGLVLFNDRPAFLSEKPLAATPANIEKARGFIRSSYLSGGTDLKNSLAAARDFAELFSGGEKNIVLISDGRPTLETTDIKTIGSLFKDEKTKLFAFGMGNDGNRTLLKDLAARTDGFYEQVRETEDISVQLKTFFAKVGATTIGAPEFSAGDADNFYQIYPTGRNAFDGSAFSFVGRYKEAKEAAIINLSARHGSRSMEFVNLVRLPGFDDFHGQLPRLWAKARIDALLDEINRDGERKDYIEEIIGLSQKYKLVTPYTAFLAAPRSLLRPRLIQPGDPVIRVKTDDSITEVFAVLPFGETLPLKYLKTEKVWETRFLAPAWMPDGTYTCRLLLTDRHGNGFEEKKTFVVDSSAPKVKIELPQKTFRAGEELELRVLADKDTKNLTAKFYGAKPVRLAWSDKALSNTGRLRIPTGLSSGKYALTVTAEDFAHNQTTAEVRIEVIGNR
jgi:Ca-activated chloride channel homolog